MGTKSMNVFGETEVDHFYHEDIVGFQDKFKDGMFRYIFKEPEKFVELYCFLTGESLDPSEIQQFDLDSLIISDWHNDVSFLVKNKHVIVLAEEQSSLCGNMAIRCLVYYSNLVLKLYYDDIGGFKKKVYGKKSLILPRPEFYVLYIGDTKNMRKEEFLSDHFLDGKSENLELKVKQLDIHYNSIKPGNSLTLSGYSYLIDRFTYYHKELKRKGKMTDAEMKKEAMRLAMEDCKKKGYLTDYLDREEFKIMATKEFTFKDYAELLAEEAAEEAAEKARAVAEAAAEAAALKVATAARTEKKQMVKKMLLEGLSMETVSKITELDEAGIKELLK